MPQWHGDVEAEQTIIRRGLIPGSGVKTAISKLDRLQSMNLAQDVLG
jgi:hypothetical protein